MIMKKVLFIMAVSAMAAGCADNSIPKAQLPELDLSNPLLAAWDTPHETPPFSEIKLADYEPAFDAAIACSRAEIDAIVNNPRKPTFGNTIVALERQGELLNRIAGLFFNLLEADTSDEMQQIAQRVQPKLTELSNDISLNPELFARVKQVYEHPGRLRKEDRKLLEDTYQSFARSGAALSDADKELYRKYTSELSGLTLRFGQNALAATKSYADADYRTVSDYAATLGFKGQLMPWDWCYYTEKYKDEKYALNDELVKPYLKLENVKKGVFMLANKLYGLNFTPDDKIEVYHPDVTAYDVTDADGRFMAVLYLDFFPRESKRSGAWMTEFRGTKIEDGKEIRPLVSLVMNFTKPTETAPSLLTFDELETFLHEFGHALHGMLGEGKYESQTGTNVYRDFVELPSQLMENWATEKEFLDLWAVHYETGEPMPAEIVDRIVAAQNYLAAYANVRQLSFGMTDMAWHTLTEPFEGDVEQFEAVSMAPTQVLPVVSGTAMAPAFGHIFSGGYAAGYYGYKWAEVLEADAFSLFKEKGIFNREAASSFRENVLSKGGTEHPMELYVRFRGHKPETRALIEKMGLGK